jgi:hypothetical protein
LLRIEDSRYVFERRLAGTLCTVSAIYRVLRVQTARKNHDTCIMWQAWRKEIIERKWPAAVLAKMENPFSWKERYPTRRLAAYEALLVPVLVGHALWVGSELVLQRHEFPNGKAEEGSLPETLKGCGLVSRQYYVIRLPYLEENIQR